jgi:predicted ATPase
MSDGTLRALGVLAAAFQGRQNGNRRVQLIGIEEPEIALHPGAAEALAEALVAASNNVQVVLTTHSPDLLEHKGFTDDDILAVVNRKGRTAIAPIDPASREALRKGLYSVGELLRIGQLEPDEARLFGDGGPQLDLFDAGAA